MSIRGSRNQMAEMTEQEWRQHLKKEFKSMELEFKKIFSEMHEEILTLKARWSRPRPDPKGSTNKVFSSSNLVESAIQNFPKFDGSDPKPWIRKCDRAFLLHPVPQDQKVLMASSQFEKEAKMWYQLVYARRVSVTWREFSEAVLDRFFNEKQEVVVYESHEEFKPPAPIIVTNPAKIQEASVDAKGNTQSDPNQNPYTPPINPPNLTPFCQTFNLNTDIPKPNTLPNTNPNTKTAQSGHQKMLPEEKKHSNTFQTLTNPNQKFTEPIPIKRLTPTEARSDHTHNLNGLTFTTVSNRGSVQTSEFWPQLTKPPIHTLPNPRFMDINRPNPWPNKLPKPTTFIRPKPWPDEPPIHTTTNTNRPTLWPGAIGNFGSPKPRNNIEENNKEGKAYHVLKRVHHRLWPTLERAAAAARLPTPFPGEDRRRSRPVSQLMILPEFDPGDFRSKEDKGRISFEFNGYLGHFGRIFEGNRRRIEENRRWFSEKRRIGIVLEENRRQIEDEVAGLSKKKKKKIWANSKLGIWIEDLGDRFVEEEDVLQSSCETASFCVSLLGIPNGGVLKEISVGLIGLAEALWQTGSIRLGPVGLLMQLVAIPVLDKMGRIAFNKFFSFGKLGQLQAWAISRLGPIGPLAIDFHFSSLGHICN